MKSIGTSLLITSALVLTTSSSGCLSRPAGRNEPTTKEQFSTTVSQRGIDKVDLLFAIDSSASMGDKQTILKDAVPNLIQGLLNPACVDRQTRRKTGKLAHYDVSKADNYGCDPADEPEFAPITDMHIGIVSSSLGDFGNFAADGSAHVCGTNQKHPNDEGHLLRRRHDGTDDAANAPDDFLAWFPTSEANADAKRHPKPSAPIDSLGASDSGEGGLIPAFEDLVVGVDQTGCGLESQLESVYRFLIQPDPWDQVLKFDEEGRADLGKGIDAEILKERAEFLRPDSLVAVIMLTDEDDSSSDPLAVNGFGYAYMAKEFPGSKVTRSAGLGRTAPRGTSVCATTPSSKDCTSCGFAAKCDPNDPWCQKLRHDRNCTTSGEVGKSGVGYDGFYAPADDDVNVRFYRMKERYGVDPQYPIQRYVDGFRKTMVPNRDGEHTVTTSSDGKRSISDYRGAAGCTNPLFAASLPRSEDEELCRLPVGGRSPDKVFFAVVGGVPNDLVHFDGAGTDAAAENNRISDADWVKILGKNPLEYDYDGIDPHMIASVQPRPALVAAGDPKSARGANGSDAVHGREWDTKKSDLQYACTFNLPTPRPCDQGSSCDCVDSPVTDGTNANPPLCAEDGSATQIKAKAYPTLRELEVVRALKDQGVIASLCPIQVEDKDAPDYGYKPAVAAIIERLKGALNAQCLPRSLRNADEEASTEPSKVPCLVLAELSPDSSETCDSLHLVTPDAAILDVFYEQQQLEAGPGAAELPKRVVCRLEQKAVAKGESCADENSLEWCYVENDALEKKTPAGMCPQAVIFSSGTTALINARFSLQCIQQLNVGGAQATSPDDEP